MADPNASGTTWTMLATLVQLMGEDSAFDYLKKLARNIDHYTTRRRRPRPGARAGRGPDRDRLPARRGRRRQAVQIRPVVSPCEGTGFEIGSLSLIKGARHPERRSSSTTGR